MTLAAMYREKKLLSIAKDVKTCLPAAHKKLVGGSFKKHDVKVIERVEKPKVDELMNSYLQLLSETEIQTDKLCIAGQNIEECIVELIARHKIKWLVMGAASDKHYSW
jgi:hypothetical protein